MTFFKTSLRCSLTNEHRYKKDVNTELIRGLNSRLLTTVYKQKICNGGKTKMKKFLKVSLSLAITANYFMVPLYAEDATSEEGYELIGTDVAYYDNDIVPIQSETWFDLPAAWPGYGISSLQLRSYTVNTNTVLVNNRLAPGGSSSSSLSCEYTTAVSGSMAISGKAINVRTGVSSNARVRAEKTISGACPYTYKGKDVHHCVESVHPRFAYYTFTETFIGMKSGEGTAKVFAGFQHEMMYYSGEDSCFVIQK